MTVRPLFLALCTLMASILPGCENSIEILAPAVPQTGQTWLSYPQTSPVGFNLKFNSRADLSAPSFKAELHDVTPPASCGPNILRDIRPDLQPVPTPGATSSAVEALAGGDYCLRLYADMRPSQAFDGLGGDYFVSVSGPTSPPPPPSGPPPPAGSYSLTLTGSGQALHFGDPASFTVTLGPANGFNDTVDLSVPGQPSLTSAGWRFAPAASINAGSGSLSSSLQGVVTPALFSPGRNNVAVQGVARMTGQRVLTSNALLLVAPAQGDFTHVYPLPQVPAAVQTDCVDGTAHVHVDYASAGPNNFQVNFTRTDLPGMPATGRSAAVYFLISQHCRVGIALNGAGLLQNISLYNLGFTGVPGWRIAQARALPANALRQQYWFSQDDSLLVVIRLIGQTPANALPPGTQLGTIYTYGASLIDPLTGNNFGPEQQFTALNLAADIKEMQAEATGMVFNMNQNGSFRDPDPDPNAIAPAIADIFKIELVRDPTGVLQAEGTFRLLNGLLDGTNFDQEFGAHPDHFGKFVLRLP